MSVAMPQPFLYPQEEASYKADNGVGGDYAHRSVSQHLVTNGETYASFHLLNCYEKQRKSNSPGEDAEPGSQGSVPEKRNIHPYLTMTSPLILEWKLHR